MRILVLTPSYPPKIGGGERYAQALAQAAVAAGHEVTVVTSDVAVNPDFWRWHPALGHMAPVTMDEDGVTVIRCPATGIPGGWPALTLWRKAMVLLSMLGPASGPLLERMARRVPAMPGLEAVLDTPPPFDLVHAYNLSWEHTVVAGWHLAQRRGVPFVLTPFAHLGAEVSARVTRNITMAHQLRILRESAGVMALPSAEADGLVALGLDRRRVHAVGTGFDMPAPSSAPVAGLEGIDGPIVAFVGRVSRDKGAMTASEAVLRLRAQGRVAPTLVLVGPVDRGYARYHSRLGAEDRRNVRLLGLLSEADKQAVLRRAGMLVLPSRVDSFGIVFLEAWAHGKPVIGARAGGIPGVIDDGHDGLLVPWGDVAALAGAIERLITHPDEAQAMGARGRVKTETVYNWPAVWAMVERVYAAALAETAAPTPDVI